MPAMSNPIQHVLITGGSGFIGSNLVRFILRERPEWRITNLDCLSYSGNPENLADLDDEPRYTFVHGDIRDGEKLAGLLGDVDAVAHLAAESHVDRSIIDSRPFIESNVLGTQVLLDAVRKANAQRDTPIRLLHVSTDEVYGSLPLDNPEVKFSEASPIQPSSPYSASKAASDLLVLAAHHTFGLDVVVTRCSNNFGPYQFPEKVIPLFVTNLIDGKKAPLYGDGLNVRDWIHTDDHCDALLTVLEQGRAGEAYNVGADNEQNNLMLTRSILSIMGCGDEMIEYVKDRPGHDRRYAIDSTKMRTELGWHATRSAWPAALEATIKWYVDNEAWWRRIRSGEYRDYYRQQYEQR